jgi:pimeloyl-ACP methyl ester carboxylesterase
MSEPLNITRSAHTHRGLSLSYLDTAPGETERPVALLLHGFPDEAHMWDGVMRPLHAAGYRCIAPDTVGCGASDMAAQRDDYRITEVCADFIDLLDHLEVDRVLLVGHDWGAVLAWYLAIHHPERVTQLVAVSVGHPTAYARAGLMQKLRSWYMVYFTMAGLVEPMLLGSGPLSARRLLPSHPDVDSVLERMRPPSRLTAALRLYRANLLTLLFKSFAPAQCPVLGIWSDGDVYLTERQMLESEPRVTSTFRYRRFAGGHWIPLDQPERLATEILEFVTP